MKKFAFLLMGRHYDPAKDYAHFETTRGISAIHTVTSLEEAAEVAANLYREGYGAIELCGAFGEAGARRIIEATEGKVAVGYVTHFPEQDSLFAAFFGG